MADDGVQGLERVWRRSGALADEVAWLHERLRTGGLSVARVRLAAACGHPAAREVAGEVPPLWFETMSQLCSVEPRVGAAACAFLAEAAKEALDAEGASGWNWQAQVGWLFEFARGGRPDVAALASWLERHDSGVLPGTPHTWVRAGLFCALRALRCWLGGHEAEGVDQAGCLLLVIAGRDEQALEEALARLAEFCLEAPAA